MADTTAASPSDMDPIQQSGISTTISNIKSFAHAPDLILNAMMTNMLNNQQTLFKAQQDTNAFNQAIQSRCINMLLDPTSSSLADAVIGQQGAKVAQTTPPVYTDPSSSLAALAAQMSTVVQLLQGLSLAPKSSS